VYRIGQREVDRVAKTINGKTIFRYRLGTECARFEERFARVTGAKHCLMTSSGTAALTAALTAIGVGPGDEVLVPACTYMATAVAVLAVGAIPVVVDIDDSITLSPDAVRDAIGPHTRAVIPVHMWGLPCDMKSIMRVARRAGVRVVEDACQAVGGGYEGRMLGSIGHVGAFSFNYYKNMSCGEGGAVITNKAEWFRRAQCSVDCCGFYWEDERRDSYGFTAPGSRASEIEGAILNVQLDRLPGMIRAMRRQKTRILKATANAGLQPIRANSLEFECGTHVMYTLPTAKMAEEFARLADGTVTINTGRHVYTEWDPILHHRGAHHPALNPYNMKENKRCRRAYSKGMCAPSLDILRRTVYIMTHPDRTAAEVKSMIQKIQTAAGAVLGA